MERFASLACILRLVNAVDGAPADDRAAEREKMVQGLATLQVAPGRSSAPPSLSADGAPMMTGANANVECRPPIANRRVLDAMRCVPREWFVPPQLQPYAYEDRPLPIGWNQTISQPYIVARMTELLDPQPGWRVLEIGTGSGYQVAVLLQFTRDIYTIEILSPLHDYALARLKRFSLASDRVLLGDGYNGLPQDAPFDAIIVTAAPEKIPHPLIEQLKPGGRMVIPVGTERGLQRLMVIRKDANGRIAQQVTQAVQFVPMTGGEQPRHK